MSKVLVEESSLSGIASAIRSKLGVQTTYKPSQMATAIQSIAPQPSLETKSIVANGTYAPSTGKDGFSQVTVNVPNTYAAGDEGKVVSNGALMAQTARASTITSNGTYDTTENNSVTVNVSGGGGGSTVDKSLMNFALITENDNYQIFLNGGKWLYNFTHGNSFMRPIDTNGNVVKPDFRNPFEIQVTFKITGTVSRPMVLFGAEQGFYYAPSIEISSNNSGLWCGLSTNGSSWTKSLLFTAGNSEINITPNTIMRVNAVWDGTDYKVTVFDGVTTLTKSVTPSATPYYSSSYNLEFGGISKSNNHYARYVDIDLENTFIKQNNVMIWGCDAS